MLDNFKKIEMKNTKREGFKVINAIRIFMTLILLLLFDYSINVIESGTLQSLNVTSAGFLLRASLMFILAYIISKIYDGRTIID